MITYVIFFILLVSIFLNILFFFIHKDLVEELRHKKNAHAADLQSYQNETNRREEQHKKELTELEAKWKEKIQKPQDSYELQQFLGDLMSGGGIVEVRRIAPTDVFVRSPRTY